VIWINGRWLPHASRSASRFGVDCVGARNVGQSVSRSSLLLSCFTRYASMLSSVLCLLGTLLMPSGAAEEARPFPGVESHWEDSAGGRDHRGNGGICSKPYDFKDDRDAIASRRNPVDNLTPLAKARIPILLIHGDSDNAVPHKESAEVIYKRYKAPPGGPVERIVKPGQDRQPHGLTDPRPNGRVLRDVPKEELTRLPFGYPCRRTSYQGAT
jgi:pimeloyl-ACP methyl ester carboxylesterase